jgi:hypothetical protein
MFFGAPKKEEKQKMIAGHIEELCLQDVWQS